MKSADELCLELIASTQRATVYALVAVHGINPEVLARLRRAGQIQLHETKVATEWYYSITLAGRIALTVERMQRGA